MFNKLREFFNKNKEPEAVPVANVAPTVVDRPKDVPTPSFIEQIAVEQPKPKKPRKPRKPKEKKV